VPPIADRTQIRNILETDRPWAAYALGDLAPGLFEQSQWFCMSGRMPALALVFRAFARPVLFTLGEPDGVRAILDEIGDEPELYLSIRSEILPFIKSRYDVRDEMAMWRMVLDPTRPRLAPAEGVVRLGPADLERLQQLYADGEPTGEAPGFFTASMLEQGVYCGVFEGEALVAAAGTHLVVPSEGVGAVGNVYTRRDRRGQGLAARVSGVVAGELLRMGLRTIVLNVAQDNGAAIRAYERVGFARYCAFFEGVAVKNGDS
jgi:ribosomal protein S18 acetylase RimI-like enzyme